MLLIGDIGGTKTHLAVFSSERGPRTPVTEAKYSSKEFADLESILQDFLAHVPGAIRQAMLAVAGPVTDGQATITNLPWRVEVSRLQQLLNITAVMLYNDLEALALGVPHLRQEELYELNTATPAAHGTIAILAAGTGLGEAYLTWDGQHYRAHPSEGGHADFAPTNGGEMALWHYLSSHYEHVSYERVCSGSGLPNIYRFLKDTGHYDEPAWLSEQLATAPDPTPLIIQAARQHMHVPCALAEAAIRMFIVVLGAEAGNLSLKLMANGGLYLGGGLPPRLLPWLETNFLSAFVNKGRMHNVLTRFPVRVILHPNPALLGLATIGLRVFQP